jgi:hypothetical protein
MGSMSIFHWLILLLLVGLIVLIVRILRRPNRLTRWMMRVGERRYFRSPPGDVEAIAATRPLESPVKPIDMAVAAAFSLTLAILLFIVARNRTEANYRQILDFARVILHLVVPFGIAAAILLHYTPNLNRVLKYRILLAISYLLPTLLAINPLENLMFSDFGRFDTFGAPRFEPVSPYANNALLWGPYLIWCAVPFVIAIFSARHYMRAYFEAATSRNIEAKLRTRYRRAMSLGATLLFYFTLSLGIAPFFLLRRFFIAERMAREPIVFLRSFQHRKSASLFGNVIAKVASRHGVVVGIAHATQTIGDLSSETSMVQQARLVTISDRQWRDWVKAQLSHATAIIIERSVGSEGVQWEIETALSMVEPSRIALLHEKGVPCADVGATFQLEYELTAEGIRQARRALDQWLITVADTAGPAQVGSHIP